MKILVGYDQAAEAGRALELAVRHAKAFGAKVYVLTSRSRGTDEDLPDIERDEERLKNAKKRLEAAGVECETHLLIRGGTPAEDIIDFAEENRVDEIIIGIAKKSRVGKLIFGSNAQYVILHAPCPVVTVQ
jgi:nucleotide-binding universal stress UspA family protein